MQEFCEPCDDKGPLRTRTVAVRRAAGDTPYWQLVADTRAVDLAYVFVESKKSQAALTI
jgi:hypothetical protein